VPDAPAFSVPPQIPAPVSFIPAAEQVAVPPQIALGNLQLDASIAFANRKQRMAARNLPESFSWDIVEKVKAIHSSR
jgi:hypothetical protein